MAENTPLSLSAYTETQRCIGAEELFDELSQLHRWTGWKILEAAGVTSKTTTTVAAPDTYDVTVRFSPNPFAGGIDVIPYAHFETRRN